jgi:DNA-binding CsgD family transcriptional regulator
MDTHTGELLGARSFAALEDSLTQSARRLGYRYFMYRGWFARSRADERDVYFDDCPLAWRDYYARHVHNRCDPLHLQAVQGSRPLLWARVSRLSPQFFARARDFGLVTGSTHPVHGPGAQWSSVSFICDRDGHAVEQHIAATLASCQLLATYAHDAVARIMREPAGTASPGTRRAPVPLSLNEREREILGLAAAGHTNSGIAGMLAISDRTVVFHLRNAREKLGAANCVHAVSKALALGLIAAA